MKKILMLLLTVFFLPTGVFALEITYEGKSKIKWNGENYSEKKRHAVPMLWGEYLDLTEVTDLQHDLEHIQWRYETHHLIGASLLNVSILYALITVMKTQDYKAFLVPVGIAGAGLGFMYWSEQTLKEYTEEYDLIHNKRPREEFGQLGLNYTWSF